MCKMKARDIFIVMYIIYSVLFDDKLLLLKYGMWCLKLVMQSFDSIKAVKKS